MAACLLAALALSGCGSSGGEAEQTAEKEPVTKGAAEEETPAEQQDRIGGGLRREGEHASNTHPQRKPITDGETEVTPTAHEGEAAASEPVVEEIGEIEDPTSEDTGSEVDDEQAALDAATRASMLDDVFDLKLEIEDSSLRLLDVRPREIYDTGHIGGAAWADLAAWKEKALSEGGLADTEYWSQQLGELGIGNATRVVVCGDPKDAARAWWLLSYLGVNHVAVLDGGIEAWQRAGEPLVSAEPNLETVEFSPTLHDERLIQIDEMLQSHNQEGVLILDTRSTEEFTTGHVPGAIHLEWSEMLAPDGTFKTPAELRAMFQAAGFDPEQQVVSYCQSGGRASVGMFALELAGYGQARNYFCSWQEWSSTDAAPIEVPEGGE